MWVKIDLKTIIPSQFKDFSQASEYYVYRGHTINSKMEGEAIITNVFNSIQKIIYIALHYR